MKYISFLHIQSNKNINNIYVLRNMRAKILKSSYNKLHRNYYGVILVLFRF